MSADDIAHRIDDLLRVIAPGGMTDADEADVAMIAEACGRIEERSVGRWINVGAGKQAWDPNGVPTPDEAAEGQERLREMIEAGVAPMAKPWNPASVCTSVGITPDQAAFFFPTRAAWNGWLAARGKVEVGGSDLKRDLVACKGPDRKALAEQTRAGVEKVVEHVVKTSNARPDGTVPDGQPIVPMAASPFGQNGKAVNRLAALPDPMQELPMPAAVLKRQEAFGNEVEVGLPPTSTPSDTTELRAKLMHMAFTEKQFSEKHLGR